MPQPPQSTAARWLAAAMIICAIASAPGCARRAVIVPPGEPVMIREPVKAAVWVKDGQGKWQPSQITIPAGWYALPDENRP